MSNAPIDAIDRAIIQATQSGLPLVSRPYHDIAERLGIGWPDVEARLRRMLDAGIIRRIGVVPNHFAVGVVANAMSVWDVADEALPKLGPVVGGLEFVSHCYERPRRPPVWPYNLFAMVHGRSRPEVDEKIEIIAGLLGDACRGRDILMSRRILKKTGMRITA